MKLIGNTLYIETKDLVDSGVKEDTIKKASYRDSNNWVIINDPDDARKILIEYDRLADKYKDLLTKRFGNPYNYVAQAPIKKMVIWDDAAERYYLDYRYDGNKFLSTGQGGLVEKYTKAASWLNMIIKASEDKRELKKQLNINITDFFVHVCTLIKLENVDLPSNYRKLLARQKQYQVDGYRALISGKLGNKSAAKVKDEVSEAILLEMIANHNQHDDVFISIQYNKWAKANNYKEIVPATVGVHRRTKEWEIVDQREGNEAFKERFQKQVKGTRPSYPMALVESDDNHLDLLFWNLETGDKFARYKAIVVMDSYNDYVLGYAYTLDNVTVDLVKAAYLNAMYYIRSITGGWYLPAEIKADNFGIAQLQPYYNNIGNFIVTPVGSKHRGYIENFFGSPHWKRCMKIGANNYSGNNMTAKHRGVNTEHLNAEIGNRPLTGPEGENQVEQFFHNLRFLPNAKGISKHQQWLEAWHNLPADKKKEITDEQFLLKFGVQHNPDQPIQITNKGVNPQINGTKYFYVLSEYNLQDIGKKVHVIYDPADMSRVLVTDFGHVRYMAYEPRLAPRALADANVGSRAMLNAIFAEKKDQSSQVSKKVARRKEVLKTYMIDPEAVLQGGVLTKELRHEAEKQIMAPPPQPDEDFDITDSY